jgi:hypothetical protein
MRFFMISTFLLNFPAGGGFTPPPRAAQNRFEMRQRELQAGMSFDLAEEKINRGRG